MLLATVHMLLLGCQRIHKGGNLDVGSTTDLREPSIVHSVTKTAVFMEIGPGRVNTWLECF
jgi:hypothetical protein